ncbi:DUF930 domain-containing protein [Pararhizobium sp. IMCC21322]|uniref:DUF930 domain-containing protein n=1 Tax=Pararhizobium sp. IMCC21322 TaxID=3067903 RepID=UPI0027413B73|nr:DUF930 domain-containing protein [Pararhizobium sp. IMCC21322]
MSIAGISKIGLEAWCLLASVTAHALVVAMMLALPAVAQPEVADEERVSVEVVTPEELQEIIEAARVEQPEPELDPSVLEPTPEPQVNVEEEAEEDAESKPENTTGADAEPAPEAAEASKTGNQDVVDQASPDAEKPEAVKPRITPGGPAAIGPKSEAEPRQLARTLPSIPRPGQPIVIPRKRVAPPEEEVVVGDRKRETLCHDAAKSEIKKSRPELNPDVVISSAIVGSEAAANVIVANGAAFRSDGRWYNFKFRCEADPFEEKLIAFDYLIGPAFPEGEVVEVKVAEEN